MNDRFPCPACAETIRREARRCVHCGERLRPDEAPDPDRLEARGVRGRLARTLAGADFLAALSFFSLAGALWGMTEFTAEALEAILLVTAPGFAWLALGLGVHSGRRWPILPSVLLHASFGLGFAWLFAASRWRAWPALLPVVVCAAAVFDGLRLFAVDRRLHSPTRPPPATC